MKIKNFIFITVGLALYACTNETTIESNENQDIPILTNYIYTSYDVSNVPNTVTASTIYEIENNKIISASGTNEITSAQHSTVYDYLDDKINEILTYRNGELSESKSFAYDGNGNLISYIITSIDSSDQSMQFNRHDFTHTTDTIFSTWMNSVNGIDYDTLILESKIVLDDNNNRTYYESFSEINNITKFRIDTYDSNQNLLTESIFSRFDDGSEFLEFENNYVANSFENIFNRINEATYTRKNMMLLYHLQSGAINNVNAKSISRNTLINFNSTWGNSFAQFEISNTQGDNNLIIESDFETIIEGNVFARFSQEYIFQ